MRLNLCLFHSTWRQAGGDGHLVMDSILVMVHGGGAVRHVTLIGAACEQQGLHQWLPGPRCPTTAMFLIFASLPAPSVLLTVSFAHGNARKR